MKFFIWTSAFGQLNKLKGTWITPAQELLLIDDTTNLNNGNYLSNSQLQDENFELFIYGDTLSFQKRYYSSRTNYEKLYVDRYDLKLLKLTDTVIIAKPASKHARDFFKGRDRLAFKRQEFAIASNLKFEKIVFHTTECFGTCSVYHLQVDRSKSFKLHAPIVYSNKGFQSDTALQGYFTGQLSDTLYNKLMKALQTSNLQTLRMRSALCCDGSISTIIVYFNGQRKYYKIMFPPTIANNLIATLYQVCQNSNGTKTNEKFKLEE